MITVLTFAVKPPVEAENPVVKFRKDFKKQVRLRALYSNRSWCQLNTRVV